MQGPVFYDTVVDPKIESSHFGSSHIEAATARPFFPFHFAGGFDHGSVAQRRGEGQVMCGSPWMPRQAALSFARPRLGLRVRCHLRAFNADFELGSMAGLGPSAEMNGSVLRGDEWWTLRGVVELFST